MKEKQATNLRDTGLCPACGGIRPDHTLEQWRNCDGKPKPTKEHWLKRLGQAIGEAIGEAKFGG